MDGESTDGGDPAGAVDGTGTGVGGRGARRVRWRVLAALAGAALLAAVMVADPYGPVGWERLRGSDPVVPGFAYGQWVTAGEYVDVSTPFWSGTVVEADEEVVIERLLVLHNASNRTVELTAVGGFTGDAAPSGYPTDEAGAGCHLATDDVAVAVDRDGVHDGGSAPERAAADAFTSGVTVPPGRLVFVWVDAGWRSGPDCASAGASYSVVSSSVWVDYQLGVREGTVAFDHDPIVVVPHLRAWLDNAFRVTREGQPVSP